MSSQQDRDRRARRIACIEVVVAARRKLHWHHPHWFPEEDCEICPTRRFDKTRPRGCGCCSKRRHGRPRVDRGICHVDERRRVYRWRNEDRAVREAIRSGRWTEDWNE